MFLLILLGIIVFLIVVIFICCICAFFDAARIKREQFDEDISGASEGNKSFTKYLWYAQAAGGKSKKDDNKNMMEKEEEPMENMDEMKME